MFQKVGFIGTGSMGTTLIKSFIASGTFNPKDLFIYNRTVSKASKLKEKYQFITISSSNKELLSEVDSFFICVKPLEFPKVLQEIATVVKEDQLAISITSPVLIKDLESILPCKIAKIIPSITNAVQQGSILYIPGSRMTTEEIELFVNILSNIGKPLQIEEEYTRIASDLASCSPAFIANILQHFINVANKKLGIDINIAEELVINMLCGVCSLLTKDYFNLVTLQKHVAVPKGITAKGLQLLNESIPSIVGELYTLTHEKYYKDLEEVTKAFASLKVR